MLLLAVAIKLNSQALESLDGLIASYEDLNDVTPPLESKRFQVEI